MGATPNKEGVQENSVGQVTVKLLQEMERIEEVRRQRYMGIDGSQAFRLSKATPSLREFILAHRLERSDWTSAICRIRFILKKEKEDLLRAKVHNYRKMMILNEELGNLKQPAFVSTAKFWRLRDVSCFVCNRKGHRTSDCKYTFDRIAKIIKQE